MALPVEEQLENHIKDEHTRYEELATDVKELSSNVRELLNMWEQAKGVVTFVKWIAAIGGSITSLILFLKK